MQVCLYLDPSRVFRWHVWLAGALAEIPGCDVFTAFARSSRPLPRSCMLLFELERLLYGLDRGDAVDPAGDLMQVAADTADGSRSFDAVIDFVADEGPLPAHKRLLTPYFNAIPGEIGIMAALVDRQSPLVELHDSARPGEPWTARPATVDRDIFLLSLNNALSCAIRLIAKALQGPPRPPSIASGRRVAAAVPDPGALARAAFARAARTVGSKMIRMLETLVKGGKGWSIGWRFDPSATLMTRRRACFSVMRTDARRYCADPFPLRRNGRNYVFMEEFQYAAGRGCISVVEIDESGRVSPPRIVLEEPFHLSYPFVFEEADQVWMIPESGDAGKVFLYRAVRFPDKWRREACLISGIQAYDSTFFRADGRVWLFVCERAWGSSSWDTLSLFHAESLTGNWLAHRDNPVVLDATLSRPAGALFSHDGQILRPVQDCTRQYGGAVGLYRIDMLGSEEFDQVLVGQIRCGAHGCHTYNRHAGLEVIDVFGPARGLREVSARFSPVDPRGAPGPADYETAGIGSPDAATAENRVPPAILGSPGVE